MEWLALLPFESLSCLRWFYSFYNKSIGWANQSIKYKLPGQPQAEYRATPQWSMGFLGHQLKQGSGHFTTSATRSNFSFSGSLTWVDNVCSGTLILITMATRQCPSCKISSKFDHQHKQKKVSFLKKAKSIYFCSSVIYLPYKYN